MVAEALTNAAKYAHASEVNVCAKTKGANLDLSIQDDGIGRAAWSAAKAAVSACKGTREFVT